MSKPRGIVTLKDLDKSASAAAKGAGTSAAKSPSAKSPSAGSPSTGSSSKLEQSLWEGVPVVTIGDERYFDFDVSSTGSCLFDAVATLYLFEVRANQPEFKARFETLFGAGLSGVVPIEALRAQMQKFKGDTSILPEWQRLIDEFRKRVLDLSEYKKLFDESIFKISYGISIPEYISLLKSDSRHFGREPEIRRMSHMLGKSIRVHARNSETKELSSSLLEWYPGEPIELYHVTVGKEAEPNHYHGLYRVARLGHRLSADAKLTHSRSPTTHASLGRDEKKSSGAAASSKELSAPPEPVPAPSRDSTSSSFSALLQTSALPPVVSMPPSTPSPATASPASTAKNALLAAIASALLFSGSARDTRQMMTVQALKKCDYFDKDPIRRRAPLIITAHSAKRYLEPKKWKAFFDFFTDEEKFVPATDFMFGVDYMSEKLELGSRVFSPQQAWYKIMEDGCIYSCKNGTKLFNNIQECIDFYKKLIAFPYRPRPSEMSDLRLMEEVLGQLQKECDEIFNFTKVTVSLTKTPDNQPQLGFRIHTANRHEATMISETLPEVLAQFGLLIESEDPFKKIFTPSEVKLTMAARVNYNHLQFKLHELAQEREQLKKMEISSLPLMEFSEAKAVLKKIPGAKTLLLARSSHYPPGNFVIYVKDKKFINALPFLQTETGEYQGFGKTFKSATEAVQFVAQRGYVPCQVPESKDTLVPRAGLSPR